MTEYSWAAPTGGLAVSSLYAWRRRVTYLSLAVAGLLVVGCRQQPWSVERAQALGIDFSYHSGSVGEKWLPEIMGAGVAVFDYDSDGRLDIYFTNGNDRLNEGTQDPLHRNRMFRQRNDGSFEDTTESSGLGDGYYGMGAAAGDVDNDGHVDLYVTNFGPDQLYLNQGNGSFINHTVEAGIDVGGFSASAAFCDYDRDGYLDLFITQYLEFDSSSHCFDPAGRRDYCGPNQFVPTPDRLLRNDGGRGFVDVSEASGIASKAAHGLGAICEDLNGDGWPDFVVANDGDANHMWLNTGDGAFVESAVRLGVAFNQQGEAEAGMGILAADLNADGVLDLFMTHLHQQHNTLYRGIGGGVYGDVTGQSGLSEAAMPFTGFGTGAIDLELDGDLDLLVANGRVRSHSQPTEANLVPPPFDYLAEPNQAFINVEKGEFEELGRAACGAFCGQVELSRGLAVGDLDGDGDQDWVVSNVESGARVYFNESPRVGRWLRVRVLDPALGRDAIGAQVELVAAGWSALRSVTTNTGYLSSSEPTLTFGVPGDVNPTELVVRWLDGTLERFPVDCLDCRVSLERGLGR